MRPALRFSPRKCRALTYTAHKWVGLSLGLLFALLGLTGSLLVFYPELDRALHPQRAASRPVRVTAYAPIVDTLRQAEPSRPGAWRIELPMADDAPITARYYKPAETAHRPFAPLILTLSPETLAVTGKHFWGDELFTWIYDLHYTLLLGDNGKTLLGIASPLIMFMLLSGLYLWWPSRGNWHGALRIKRGAVWKRRIYDLHAKPGAYGFLVLFVITTTGLFLVAPRWFTPAIERLSPTTPYFQGGTAKYPGSTDISADQAVAISLQRFPGAAVRWIHTPSSDRAVWRIQLYQAGEPSRRFPRTNVWIDANSGAILAIRDPHQNSAGDTFLDWLHPLHNGEAFGLAGRILVLLGGLLPLLAFATGITRWQHKRRPDRKTPPAGARIRPTPRSQSHR